MSELRTTTTTTMTIMMTIVTTEHNTTACRARTHFARFTTHQLPLALYNDTFRQKQRNHSCDQSSFTGRQLHQPRQSVCHTYKPFTPATRNRSTRSLGMSSSVKCSGRQSVCHTHKPFTPATCNRSTRSLGMSSSVKCSEIPSARSHHTLCRQRSSLETACSSTQAVAEEIETEDTLQYISRERQRTKTVQKQRQRTQTIQKTLQRTQAVQKQRQST